MKRSFVIADEYQLKRMTQILSGPVQAGQKLSVTVEPYRKSRSVEQNARYWAMLTEISQQMPSMMNGEWHAPEVWAEYFKRRFLGVEVVQIDRNPIPIPKSTRKLNTSEFMGYMDEIQAWAHENGIIFSEAA